MVFDHSWQLLGPAEREALGAAVGLPRRLHAPRRRARSRAPLPVLGALADKSLLRKDGRRASTCIRWCSSWPPSGSATASARTDAETRACPVTSIACWRRCGGRSTTATARRCSTLDAEFENCRAGLAARCVPTRSRRSSSPAASRTVHALLRPPRPLRRGAGADARGARRPTRRRGARPARPAAERGAATCSTASTAMPRRCQRRRAALADTTPGARPARPAAVPARCSAPARCASARFADARRYFRQALDAAPARGDPHNAAAMLDNLALVEKRDGPLRRGAAHVARVAGAAPPPRRRRRRGAVPQQPRLAAHAIAATTPSALAAPARGLAIVRTRTGWSARARFVLANLAEMAVEAGELDAGARRYATGALELARPAGNRATEACDRLLLVQSRCASATRRRSARRARPCRAGAGGRPAARLPLLQRRRRVLRRAARGRGRAPGGARRLLRFAIGHPAMTGAEPRTRSAPASRRSPRRRPATEPPWPGPALDELVRRIVAETPAAHAGLVAALRAAG